MLFLSAIRQFLQFPGELWPFRPISSCSASLPPSCFTSSTAASAPSPQELPPGSLEPSPPRSLPLLGALPFLGKKPFETFVAWRPLYGPIVCLNFAGQRCVVLSDLELIKETANEPAAPPSPSPSTGAEVKRRASSSPQGASGRSKSASPSADSVISGSGYGQWKRSSTMRCKSL